MEKIRLHILGIPYAITRSEYSNCAFTGKVQRFAPMMRSRGYEVYHYGIETSESGADHEVNLLTVVEWKHLCKLSYRKLKPNLTEEEVDREMADPKTQLVFLAQGGTPLYDEFNHRLKMALKFFYRSRSTDIVCLPLGKGHIEAINGMGFVCVETGIGYADSFLSYRIFESYAQLHVTYSLEKKNYQSYWFVVPNYYNINEWKFVSQENLRVQEKKRRPRIGIFGRVCREKGVGIFIEISRRFPEVDFLVCGQGTPEFFVNKKENFFSTFKDLEKKLEEKREEKREGGIDNVYFLNALKGADRSDFLGSLSALITPSGYVEPFCGVNVEAQLCGTPVISHDFGAMAETIENFKTGLLCHSLADFCKGVQMSLDGEFDRGYIRERAVKKYDMYRLAARYDYIFKSILEIDNGNDGWYSPNSFIELSRSSY